MGKTRHFFRLKKRQSSFVKSRSKSHNHFFLAGSGGLLRPPRFSISQTDSYKFLMNPYICIEDRNNPTSSLALAGLGQNTPLPPPIESPDFKIPERDPLPVTKHPPFRLCRPDFFRYCQFVHHAFSQAQPPFGALRTSLPSCLGGRSRN